jgi:hypothetical protein
MKEHEDGLVKIYVDLPNHWGVAGEAMWARPVGQHRYEIRNVPFHAFDLNFLDVVEAAPEGSDPRPRVRRVIRRGGHQTLRVVFHESALLEERIPLLRELRAHGASFEGASQSYFAIDVEPGGDYRAVVDQLARWQQEGILRYESCEARVPGSFDEPTPGR